MDSFFNAVPDAQGCYTSTEPAEARRAMRAWDTEPVSTAHGVRLAPLRRAISDLVHGLNSDKGDTACYPAAIADLKSLESATPGQIAASSKVIHQSSTIRNLDGFRIAYVNGFFSQFDYKTFFPVLEVGGT
jgi:hypothetical protein